MWQWIHEHREDLLALGPVATIFAASIAVLVSMALGLAQWRVASAQRNISYDKLKLDLFEKRHAIYQSAKELAATMFEEKYRVPAPRRAELEMLLKQARYFFPQVSEQFARRIVELSGEWEENLISLESANEAERETLSMQRKGMSDEAMDIVVKMEKYFYRELAFAQFTNKPY